MKSSEPAARRPVLTGRAMVLGGVVVLLVVLLASPVQRYLSSRAALTQASRQLQDDRHDLAQLRRQKALWSDPGYIQQQARIRLQYAMPGDTVYVVVDKGQQTQIEQTTGAPGSTAQRPGWNVRLMDSVHAAAR